jgi:hypothetical protein
VRSTLFKSSEEDKAYKGFFYFFTHSSKSIFFQASSPISYFDLYLIGTSAIID